MNRRFRADGTRTLLPILERLGAISTVVACTFSVLCSETLGVECTVVTCMFYGVCANRISSPKACFL
jgi:hypothetical protein